MGHSKKGLIATYIISGVCILTLGGCIGFIIGTKRSSLPYEESKLVAEYDILKNEWLFADDDLANDAASGILYYPAAMKNDASYTRYTGTMEGQGLSTSGVGFGFSSHPYNGGLYVMSVFDNGPASGKLQAGDVLNGVKRGNEQEFVFSNHSYSEINSYLAEDSNTQLDYSFYVEGKANPIIIRKGNFEETLVNVLKGPSTLPEGTYAVKINTFLGYTAQALKGTLSHLNKPIQHLILDLRGNGGGDVSQAASIAKLFVKKGTLIYEFRDKNNKVIEQVKQDKDPEYNIPRFSILIDGQTASASEILTLAMRAGTNTTVYGLKSYGKGIAQKLTSFSDGSVMKYTYAYVYGPEKENETMYEEGNDDDQVMCIHKKGIIPDVVYPKDFMGYYDYLNFSSSLSVSETYMKQFIEELHELDSTYPSQYSENYHFYDAIEEFSSKQSLGKPFDNEGKVSQEVTNRFSKITFDEYLRCQDEMTKLVWEAV